jgi:hypothetical protein
MRRHAPFCAVVLAGLVGASAAGASPPPPGSTWTQASIVEPDGTRLHADILRPSNLPPDARTPVILSIGPSFNHSGQVGPAGPLEGTPYHRAGAYRALVAAGAGGTLLRARSPLARVTRGEPRFPRSDRRASSLAPHRGARM